MKCYICLFRDFSLSHIDKVFLSKERASYYVDGQNKISDFYYYIEECQLISDDIFDIIKLPL